MAVAPEIDDEGNLIRVFGAIVDISDRKRAEAEQRKRLEESMELRRQQENFIDMTSHEVRLLKVLTDNRCGTRCLRYYSLPIRLYSVSFVRSRSYPLHSYHMRSMMPWTQFRP
jgi:hypothetical protein